MHRRGSCRNRRGKRNRSHAPASFPYGTCPIHSQPKEVLLWRPARLPCHARPPARETRIFSPRETLGTAELCRRSCAGPPRQTWFFCRHRRAAGVARQDPQGSGSARFRAIYRKARRSQPALRVVPSLRGRSPPIRLRNGSRRQERTPPGRRLKSRSTAEHQVGSACVPFPSAFASAANDGASGESLRPLRVLLPCAAPILGDREIFCLCRRPVRILPCRRENKSSLGR